MGTQVCHGIRIKESWSKFQAVSMVGGTIRRKLIHRESFRASVLHRSDNDAVKKKHRTGVLCLDNAFALIDAVPKVLSNLFATRR